ncbi:MAG TPA: phosphate ABC transporter permease subunit PstC [Candidatus Mailhella merdavium]|nr:phosphate ABC transporter permease subunit PstC [Candidatus Mailhella merdavium]
MKNVSESVMQVVFMLTACASVAAVALICIFMFAGGAPALFKIGLPDFLFGLRWKPLSELFGIFPMIVGSFCVTAGALILGVPLGVLTAVFLVYFCPGFLRSPLKQVVDLMAGIPSIVYGFFGLVVLVPLMQDFGGSGKGMLTASIILAIMIVPTIAGVAEASLRAVPDAWYEASLALGAPHERSVFFVMVPGAASGILAGIILGMGRALGETMAVIMVAGNQAVLPSGLMSGVRTLTANIVLEMGYAADLHREALIATAVVLFVFILIINIAFSMVKRSMLRKLGA